MDRVQSETRIRPFDGVKDRVAAVPGVTCAALKNHGTHFTVDINVGTPKQVFSVVADTGSNSLIIPSCVCTEANICHKEDRCFRGTNKSETFEVAEEPHQVLISYGSGDVQAVISTDVVRVGEVEGLMKDSLLLMTSNSLRFSDSFEGIMGLGMPLEWRKKAAAEMAKQQARAEGREEQADGDGDEEKEAAGGKSDDVLQDVIDDIMRHFPGVGKAGQGDDKEEEEAAEPAWKKAKMHLDNDPGFLEFSHSENFSLCFNDGQDGVLKLGGPMVNHTHSSVGVMHWGLDFQGIRVGDAEVPVNFCQEKDRKENASRACAAIPDSGTTAILAPQEHIEKLFGAVCDGWERCRKNHTALEKAAAAARDAVMNGYGADPFGIAAWNKSKTFEMLMADCNSWWNDTDSRGLDELPDLHLHVGGGGGDTLALPGWAYVFEVDEEEREQTKVHVPLFGDITIPGNKTGRIVKQCQAAFSRMEYSTPSNGNVWIVGTPLFYMYQVHFSEKSVPPSIGFTALTKEAPCGSCGGRPALFEEPVKRRPRYVQGPFREPKIDVTREI